MDGAERAEEADSAAPLVPETTVLGRFVRAMAGQIAGAADPERRAVLQEALRLGVAALRGELEEP